MEKIIIAGISGFIGGALAKTFQNEGFEVVGLSRHPEKYSSLTSSGIRLLQWNGTCPDKWFSEVEGAKAIINLIGENIAGKPWKENQRQRILNSRIQSIHVIQDAISRAEKKPHMYIQTSAIGYYGAKTEGLNYENHPSGDGFLADVCVKVENEAIKVSGVKVVIARFGVVLGAEGGALKKITDPMKFRICGIPGSGNNMVSWIHIDDLTRGFLHLINNQEARSPVYNFTSPGPVRLKDLVLTASHYLNTLICLPVPKQILALINGKEMVKETILADQQIYPGALVSERFQFVFPEIDKALADILT